jgi:Skp family chaperone for outer membrane proteins
MSSWIITSIVTFLLLAPAVAFAQKIGYVSTDAIRAKYESNKQAEERLNAYVEEWKAELAQKQKDIDELELEMRKNRLIWSEQERQTKEKELEEKRRERDTYARMKFEPGGEHDQQAETLFKAIWNKIYSAIQKVSATEGYDIVWDKSTQPLVYVNAKYDITVKVMKELGIDADELERKQKEVVDSDPRNKKAEETRRRKSRSRATADTTAATTPKEQQVLDPVVLPDGLMPNGLPPNGQVPGGGPARNMPTNPPPLPTDTTRTDSTRKDDVPR